MLYPGETERIFVTISDPVSVGTAPMIAIPRTDGCASLLLKMAYPVARRRYSFGANRHFGTCGPALLMPPGITTFLLPKGVLAFVNRSGEHRAARRIKK
jgi:hypothetical protein